MLLGVPINAPAKGNKELNIRRQIGKTVDNQYYNNANEPMSPIVQERTSNPGNVLSARTYTFMLTLLVFIGFAVMGVCSSFAASPAFLMGINSHYLVVTIVSFVVSIASVFVMNRGRESQSVGLSLVGYAMMVLSLGFTTSLSLLYYDLGTISTAFLATAAVTVVMGCLGMAFPQFFAKIQGALFFSLLGIIVIEIPLMLFNISAGWLDYIVVAVFAGFIGRDFYIALNAQPTMANAIFNASQLYLDILNVFMRIVSILGNRRD